jgi:NitT/TauT family transport system permease protein
MKSVTVTVSVVGGLLLGWHLAVWLLRVPPWIMPSPVATVIALVVGWRSIISHLGYTLLGAFLGLLFSTTIGLALAAVFALSKRISAAVMPFLVVIRTIPVVAVAPLLVMGVGRTLWTSVAVTGTVSFFPILVNSLRGFGSTPVAALEMIHVAGANWRQELVKVRFRYALPHIFTGMRIATGSALLGAMLAEWLAGTPGLGFLILDSAAMQNTAQLWAVALVAMTAGLALYGITVVVERNLVIVPIVKPR